VSDDGADEREGAIDRAARALARRDYSAAGLRARLDRTGLSDEAQADAVETLERLGYVDDERFARDRAARLADRGYGDDWIRTDLEAEGVDAETAAASVAALEPEDERAGRALAGTGDAARRLQRLARRGFSEETIERLADALRTDGSKE
jgi:regulatory protein